MIVTDMSQTTVNATYSTLSALANIVICFVHGEVYICFFLKKHKLLFISYSKKLLNGFVFK
jgi:hypothetical protein